MIFFEIDNMKLLLLLLIPTLVLLPFLSSSAEAYEVGTLEWSQDVYETDDVVLLTVTDGDWNRNSTKIEIREIGILTLGVLSLIHIDVIETDINTGIFQGTFEFKGNPDDHRRGLYSDMLSVHAGQSFYATYRDHIGIEDYVDRESFSAVSDSYVIPYYPEIKIYTDKKDHYEREPVNFNGTVNYFDVMPNDVQITFEGNRPNFISIFTIPVNSDGTFSGAFAPYDEGARLYSVRTMHITASIGDIFDERGFSYDSNPDYSKEILHAYIMENQVLISTHQDIITSLQTQIEELTIIINTILEDDDDEQ